MNVLILADNDSFLQIELIVKGLCSFLCEDPLQISRNKALVAAADLIITDEQKLEELTFSDVQNVVDEKAKLYVYFHGTLIDAKNNEQFEALDKELIESERFSVLKKINELKLKLNYLFRSTILNSYPVFIQMELTDVCNSECIMCFHLYQKNKHTSFLSREGLNAAKAVLPYVKVAILHGNGEPFLHPMLDEILEEFCRYNICVSTSTNLSVFNDKIAGYINKCFSDICVSCDGCTKEIYEQVRRNLSFENLTNNMRMLNQLCPDVKKLLMVVIMRQNIHQLEQFIPFAKEYGFSTVSFTNMMPSIALDNESDSPLHFMPQVKAKLRQIRQLSKELGIDVVFPDCYDDCEEKSDSFIEPTFRTDEEIEQLRQAIKKRFKSDSVTLELLENCNWSVDRVKCSGICDWCMGKTYIDLHGNMFVCCINNRYVLGNIHETAFENIWNGTQMQLIRSSFFSGTLPDFCEGCHFILKNTLPHLHYVNKTDSFFSRRCISKMCKEIADELGKH